MGRFRYECLVFYFSFWDINGLFRLWEKEGE